MRSNKVDRERVVQLLGKGVKPVAIAERLGCSRAAVSRIEAELAEATNEIQKTGTCHIDAVSCRPQYKRPG